VWQDIVLAVGSISFAGALVPSLRSSNKPALATSVITGGWLSVFAATYATLRLWFATATTAVTAALWVLLAMQTRRQSKH
jgi:hypothetical protein